MQADVNGTTLNYNVEGFEDAPAVVLHHPLATNLSSWDELTAALLAEGYRVLRMDARGHGRSGVPAGPYDFETLAGDMVALMDHVGIAKARFVGLSMGGMVGQYLGILHPARFHCLSLVSTSSAVPAEAAQLWIDRVKLVREGGMAAAVDGAMARWVAPDAMAGRPDLVARLKGMIASTPVEGYVGWCQAISTLGVTDRLRQVTLPTQVIVGALDPATPPAAARTIHRNIAGSEYVELPGVSHMLQLEEPASFHAALLPFLAKHGPAATA